MDNEYWLNEIESKALHVLKEKFAPVKVLLFGSRAKGNFNKDSDIDLIIVSETFKDVPMIRRMSVVLKELKFPKHIDVLCYTPEEFERIQNTSAIVKDALLNSVAIV